METYYVYEQRRTGSAAFAKFVAPSLLGFNDASIAPTNFR
jgi:hypothetical protein